MSYSKDSMESDGRMVLNAAKGIGPITLNRLMEKFSSDPWEILSASEDELKQVRGVGNHAIASIKQTLSSSWLEKEKQKLNKMGGRFLHGSELPEFLAQLMDPPIGLYCFGEIPKLPCVSIVGTRSPSIYGKKIARRIAYELAQSGICIASGMARGIDSEAHKGALEAGGKTLAFLGSGLDVIYPPENFELYKNIQSSGAVLSEFPLGRRADRRTFPMRNRLVAGVALGVVVIESAESGGSMITARLAAEQGRTVFALPGRVDQSESHGCLALIRDGATLIRNSNDILEELAPMLEKTVSSKLSNPSSDVSNYPALDSDENLIMCSLANGERLDSDELQKSTQISISKIFATITMLEIRGLIKKRTDGRYEIS